VPLSAPQALELRVLLRPAIADFRARGRRRGHGLGALALGDRQRSAQPCHALICAVHHRCLDLHAMYQALCVMQGVQRQRVGCAAAPYCRLHYPLMRS